MLVADRYDPARCVRIRWCRACDEWLPIGGFDWAYNATGRRRRRVCRECRNQDEAVYSRTARARRKAA